MLKTYNPKVSIVIPVYNGSNYLKEAIDSALAQTYKNIEIIVVNDGSNDNGATEKIAKSYGNKIKYYKKNNGGVATALNFGIKKMTGEYFSWLSHDDMYEKTKIEEQIGVLKEKETDNLIVACNARALFTNGIKKNEYIDKSTFDFIDIFLSTSAVTGLNGCSLLIPKKALEINDGFNVNLPYTQDYDLWFRLKDNFKFVLLERNLVISRRHNEQDSVQKQKLCFDAADKLHYDFLNSLSNKRFEEFFIKNSKNIENYWNNYIVYKNNGYKKTASMMLKFLLFYYSKSDVEEFNKIYNTEIGPQLDTNLLIKGKSKKRILFYSNVWHMGGIERVLSHIFTRFCDEYECILVTNKENSNNKSEGFVLPISVTQLKINNTDQVAELLNLISLLDIDLFIGNPNYSESFISVYPFLEQTKTKSIAYNHGHYFLPYMMDGYLYPTALKIKEVFKTTEHVVWLSRAGCNLYNLENDNGVYIANPVTIEQQKPRTKIQKNMVAIGRFDDEIKRIDKILLVFKELNRIDSKFRLDIVGYCFLEMNLPWLGNITLKDFIRNQNIPSENITFWGEQDDVLKFYDTAGFLLLTSRCEGFALVLTEALSKGVPCAAFDYIGLDEIVQDGYNGYVTSQNDYKALATKIATTINDKNTYSELSKNALRSVKQFDEKIFYEKWDNLLKSTLGIEVADNLDSLKPDKKLNDNEYKKIILEYEKLLNIAAENYLKKDKFTVLPSPRTLNLAARLKTSIRRDGVYLTGEKIARKVNQKIKKYNKKLV